MLSLKAGVRLTDLCTQCVLAALIVDGIFTEIGLLCVITSVNDSKHSPNSWHYKGRAFDVRTKYDLLNGQEEALRDRVKAALGDDFDVVIEAIGTENEHLHIEYDPKEVA